MPGSVPLEYRRAFFHEGAHAFFRIFRILADDLREGFEFERFAQSRFEVAIDRALRERDCHGRAGRGDGPMVAQLRKAPPDLTKYTARNGGVFPAERLRRIIDGRDVSAHGDPAMPVWGDVFRRTAGDTAARERVDALVTFVEGLQERGAE